MDRNLTEIQKAMIYVLGGLDGLVKNGLVSRTEPFYYLTPAGEQHYQELIASGYEPDKDTLTAAVTIFRQIESEDEQPGGAGQ